MKHNLLGFPSIHVVPSIRYNELHDVKNPIANQPIKDNNAIGPSIHVMQWR